jgi:hypothetical protein
LLPAICLGRSVLNLPNQTARPSGMPPPSRLQISQGVAGRNEEALFSQAPEAVFARLLLGEHASAAGLGTTAPSGGFLSEPWIAPEFQKLTAKIIRPGNKGYGLKMRRIRLGAMLMVKNQLFWALRGSSPKLKLRRASCFPLPVGESPAKRVSAKQAGGAGGIRTLDTPLERITV